MLDKKLYRDVSDLLDLNVSDDKIIRILMVRGYTTEKVKRSIRDIRTKGELVKKLDRCSVPVEEIIEGAPSKRFNMLDKIFGKKSTDDELIKEEIARLAAEEERLMKEAACIHKEIEKDLIKASKGMGAHHVNEEVRDVLHIMDRLLEKLPEKEVKAFAKSEQYKKYKDVMEKYLGKQIKKVVTK